VERLEALKNSSEIWGDPARAREIVSQLKTFSALVRPMTDALKRVEDLEVMLEMAREDTDFAEEFLRELQILEKEVEKLETQGLLSGPMDERNAILTIHARDGGIDANDWAEMLLRMYINWAESRDFDVEILDRQDNEEAGITSATIAIRGAFAYGYLKGESGIHRLVRISPFNAEGKRQTSFAAVDVSPEVEEETDIHVDWEKDVREDVFRSGGAGGQHVNKTSSAVRLTHLPTGIVVMCQNERSQHQNRATARKMLLARLARIEEEKREAEQAAKYRQMPKVGFGSQIRSYFLHPEQRVKDARTGYTVYNFHAVMDGEIQGFLEAYLRWRAQEGSKSSASPAAN
jgi:peptide chain release factor 2